MVRVFLFGLRNRTIVKHRWQRSIMSPLIVFFSLLGWRPLTMSTACTNDGNALPQASQQ